MLGINNNRSPVGALVVSNNRDRIMRSSFTAWFECWLVSYVPKLMKQPKWFHSSRDIKIGDIVLFNTSMAWLSPLIEVMMVEY